MSHHLIFAFGKHLMSSYLWTNGLSKRFHLTWVRSIFGEGIQITEHLSVLADNKELKRGSLLISHSDLITPPLTAFFRCQIIWLPSCGRKITLDASPSDWINRRATRVQHGGIYCLKRIWRASLWTRFSDRSIKHGGASLSCFMNDRTVALTYGHRKQVE